MKIVICTVNHIYSNKILTTGEGGMCTTNSPELNEEIMALKAHYLKSGRNVAGTYIKSTSDKFVHDRVGFNYRSRNKYIK